MSLFFFLLFTTFSLLVSRNFSRLLGIFFFSLVLLILGAVAVFFFQKSALHFQCLHFLGGLDLWNFSFILGVDGLSFFLLLLSGILVLFCGFNYWYVKYNTQWYFFLLAISLWFLFTVFTVLDFILFFFFFEAVVVPMYLLVGIWGSRFRRIYAAYQLFLYTIAGSIFMLICFFDLYFQQGTASLLSFDLSYVYHEERQWFLWLFLFFGFMVKLPAFPVHIWLPEAHVEAPTPGSILLAGVILKLGSYGLIRFFYGSSLSLSFPEFSFWIYALALLGFIYGSLIAFNQQDLKKAIAYASIAHMNFSVLGLFSGHVLGVLGAILLAIGHGLGAAGLFFGIGVLYDRYRSRLIAYYGGLALLMPLFSSGYFFFFLANIGFPGTLNFAGEFFLLSGLLSWSLFTAFVTNFGLILTLIYTFGIFNRVFFGTLKDRLRFFTDASRLEWYLMLPLILAILLGGLYPQGFVDFILTFLSSRAL